MMTKTMNEAIAILTTGNEAAAWEVAQQDEGLLPGVTFSQWIAFARDCIANREAEAAIDYNMDAWG